MPHVGSQANVRQSLHFSGFFFCNRWNCNPPDRITSFFTPVSSACQIVILILEIFYLKLQELFYHAVSFSIYQKFNYYDKYIDSYLENFALKQSC